MCLVPAVDFHAPSAGRGHDATSAGGEPDCSDSEGKNDCHQDALHQFSHHLSTIFMFVSLAREAYFLAKFRRASAPAVSPLAS